MLPGSTIIRKCSACSKPIEQDTIASGNTFGATFWTDGKCEAPMLPDQPWLIMCPHCYAPLWIDELEDIGEIEPWGENNKFEDAKPYELPDYFAILETGTETSEKERYIRLRTWWSGNDIRRYQDNEIEMSIPETLNLTAFAQMLDESDSNDLVMKSEAMRELACFDEAKTLLARSVDNNLSQTVEIIKDLVEKRDSYVRKMHFK